MPPQLFLDEVRPEAKVATKDAFEQGDAFVGLEPGMSLYLVRYNHHDWQSTVDGGRKRPTLAARAGDPVRVPGEHPDATAVSASEDMAGAPARDELRFTYEELVQRRNLIKSAWSEREH